MNTAYIMLFAAFLVGLMAYLLSSPVLMMLGTPERIEKNALTYMHMQCLGVPLSVQYSLIAVSCMGLQSVVNSFGATAVAAFTATGRIEQLVNQPYITLSTALSTYTGQNYGAKKKERILEGFHKSMMIMGIFTLIMVPVMQIFGNTIIKVFVNEPDVIGVWGIWWAAGLVWMISAITCLMRYLVWKKKYY